MNVEFRESFLQDIRSIKDKTTKSKLQDIIASIENAENLTTISNVKRLKGASQYYRIRLGDYRIGISLHGKTVTFVRFLHRREIYRYFP